MKKLSIVLFSFLIAILSLSSCAQPKELVYLGMDSFSIKQAGLKQTTISMNIRLYNPNRYKLKLKKADVDVFINNSHVGKMNVNCIAELAKRDSSSLPVTLDVDLANALPNALQLLLNPEITLKITGNIIAGRQGVYITIPVNYEGKQDILSGIKW